MKISKIKHSTYGDFVVIRGEKFCATVFDDGSGNLSIGNFFDTEDGLFKHKIQYVKEAIMETKKELEQLENSLKELQTIDLKKIFGKH